jgi:branched-subunit amino acid aminotransferase/4-amino-4-deoxychorismate lyase
VPGDDVRVEVNGQEADQTGLSLLEYQGWGHFSAMQVRGGRTRGLDLHLARLEAAHREVYGRALSGAEVRARIRHALAGQPDASVRVYGYWAGLIVTVREPHNMPRRPHSMTAVHFQRPLARLKHAAGWAQGRFREVALAAGFDEGLLVDEAGRISEGAITNVGFCRDSTVIWPDAPKLPGITMLLLRRQLTAAGIRQAEAVVRVQDLASYDGMILCNARGWAPVGRVDELVLAQDEAFTGIVAAAFDGCPWDEI